MGETACSRRIPKHSRVDVSQNRKITCPVCLSQIYDIKSNPVKGNRLSFKNMKNNDDLVKLIYQEIERLGITQSDMARRLNITPGFLNDVLHGRAPVTSEIAKHFGYAKVTGFIYENKASKGKAH